MTWVPHYPPRKSSWADRLARFALAWLLLLGGNSLLAQPAPLEPMFGIGDNEFFLGGWNPPRPGNATKDTPQLLRDSVHQVLDWMDWYRIKVLRTPIYAGYDSTNNNAGAPFLRALATAADPTDKRLILHGLGSELNMPSYGREAKFYLIPDSFPYNSWKCKFRYLNGGFTDTNASAGVRDDWNKTPKERRYWRDSLAANTVIADSLLIDMLHPTTFSTHTM